MTAWTHQPAPQPDQPIAYRRSADLAVQRLTAHQALERLLHAAIVITAAVGRNLLSTVSNVRKGTAVWFNGPA